MAESKFEPRQIYKSTFPYSGCKEQQLRFLLKYAILAPSHYNTQPWTFRIDPEGIDVLQNISRGASFVDPHLRELTISCGAAIRMVEVAARYFLNMPSVLFPTNNQGNHLARMELSNSYEPSAEDILLFNAIKQRQTNRGWFTSADIPNNVLESCHAAAEELGVALAFTSERVLKESFAVLTASAVRQQQSMPWYRLEFSSWLRSPLSYKSDGVTGFGFFASCIPLPLMETTIKWLDRGKQIGDFNRKKIISGSPIFAVISTDSDTKENWTNTGRLLSHLLLALTTAGLSASFMNQAIEVSELRKQVSSLFDCGANPQLILRIGVAQEVHWTSRMPVDDCLI